MSVFETLPAPAPDDCHDRPTTPPPPGAMSLEEYALAATGASACDVWTGANASALADFLGESLVVRAARRFEAQDGIAVSVSLVRR